MTVLSTSSIFKYDDEQIALTREIFEAVGRVAVVDDELMDVCTALAASGPAFALTFVESLADGGVMMGLSRSDARLLAAQVIERVVCICLFVFVCLFVVFFKKIIVL